MELLLWGGQGNGGSVEEVGGGFVRPLRSCRSEQSKPFYLVYYGSLSFLSFLFVGFVFVVLLPGNKGVDMHPARAHNEPV